MCKLDASQPDLCRDSSLGNTSDASSDASDHGTATLLDPSERSPLLQDDMPASYQPGGAKVSSTANTVAWSVLGAIASAFTVVFALWFPFFLAPHAALKTYDWAYYSYDDDISHFDNTFWTYATDYLLAAVMLTLTWSTLQNSRPGVSDTLCRWTAALLASYAVSVVSGGAAHQSFTTTEQRNSLLFRLLWTVCVGTVTGATTFMGLAASQAVQRFQKEPYCSPLLRRLIVVPPSFWYAFGLGTTAVCAYGGMSFQRPACDIFIAGITQVPSSFYVTVFYLLAEHEHIDYWCRWAGSVAFVLNAPLLPMYPLLVQYTDLSLAAINTLLHCWLCVAWTMQGVVLRHAAKALVLSSHRYDRVKKSS